MNPFERHQKTIQSNTIDDFKIKTQIEILKEELTQSDYQIIKCYEYSLVGNKLPYNIETLHKERQIIRDKINKLQGGDNK